MMYIGPDHTTRKASLIGPAQPAQAVPEAYINADANPDFDSDSTYYSALATNPATTPCLLEWVYMACPAEVLHHVATNPSTPGPVLTELAYHPDFEVRVAVAENIKAPVEALRTLAHDDNPDVRYQLAENHRLPLAVLELLAEDENPYVVARARQTIRRLTGGTRGNVTELRGQAPIRVLNRLFTSIHKYARAI